MSTTTTPERMLTDYAGNTYPASALNEQETPNWDPHGAKKDQAWKAIEEIAKQEHAQQAQVGSKVTVTGGRKHKGKTGIVFWRGKDKFAPRSRYGSDMQQTMADVLGFRDRLGIQTESGEKFFVRFRDAKKV